MTNIRASDVAAEVRAEMARQQLNRTHAEFAAELGMSRQAFSERLSGEIEWRITEIVQVADILGVPLASFLRQYQPTTGSGA